ncbi:MAG: hypothetical protein Q8912_01045 [Bacillota bacterium]|nr:hypothetical protein [Bacillota bacterium]MDP4158320.1 hypothetical protein [Bacillota bacterium]
MIFAQSSFIPLYFAEEEADLWQALQRIEPEKRSSFIKGILRQVLINENNPPPQDMLSEDTRESSAYHQEETIIKSPDEVPEDDQQEFEQFSLESLFTEVLVPESDMDYPLPSKGYDYMMKHIIGTEEDEEVLKILQGSP